MNKTLFSAAAAAAALALLPLTAQAQVTLAQDNASSSAYGGTGYSGLNGGTGFGAFNVAATGSAGTFQYTSTQSEDGSADIDSPAITAGGSPLSFGVYSQTATSTAAITRSFNVGPTSGDTFSLDFVTGYNDGANGGGTSGVSLTNAAGTFGTFEYESNDTYLFNGAAISNQGYNSGALHLVYDITSATTYSLAVTGPFSFTGAGTFAGPVTGFEVAQTDSGANTPDHNAYFNNLLETAPAAAPVPEASTTVSLGLLLALGLGGFAVARKRSVTA